MMHGGTTKAYSVGFTIIEVMIFLTISGLTFVIAASFINGKEAKAEFQQGMNNTNALLQGVINDGTNGNYPAATQSNDKCLLTSGSTGSIELRSSGQDICQFVGKVIKPSGLNYQIKTCSPQTIGAMAIRKSTSLLSTLIEN